LNCTSRSLFELQSDTASDESVHRFHPKSVNHTWHDQRSSQHVVEDRWGIVAADACLCGELYPAHLHISFGCPSRRKGYDYHRPVTDCASNLVACHHLAPKGTPSVLSGAEAAGPVGIAPEEGQ